MSIYINLKKKRVELSFAGKLITITLKIRMYLLYIYVCLYRISVYY